MGLGGRLHLAWISSAEAQKFAGLVAEFTEHVRSLGPNPLKAVGDRIRSVGPQPLSGKKKPAQDPSAAEADEDRQAARRA